MPRPRKLHYRKPGDVDALCGRNGGTCDFTDDITAVSCGTCTRRISDADMTGHAGPFDVPPDDNLYDIESKLADVFQTTTPATCLTFSYDGPRGRKKGRKGRTARRREFKEFARTEKLSRGTRKYQRQYAKSA